MPEFFSLLNTAEQIIYGVLLFTTLYQVFVWIGFSVIAAHRHHGKVKPNEPLPAVSVVVVIEEGQEWYAEEELDKLLTQQYDGDWEVIVVNDCAGAELSCTLASKAAQYPVLRYTELKTDPRFRHSRKIPLLVGIKAATKPNILIADPSASPISERWLSIMARGFVGAQIVIGYTGFDKGTSGMIRASRFYTSIRYLRAAVTGRAYRGIYNNIGYGKDLYFASRGFTHLRLALGEDDLFIQKIAPRASVGIMLNPHATMRQHAYGGIRWWWRAQRYYSYSFRYYPARVKFNIALELIVRTLFFSAVGATAFITWQWGWTIGVGAFVLRELVLLWSSRRIARRLGEKRLLLPLLVYDLIAPITESVLAISRRMIVSKGVWK